MKNRRTVRRLRLIPWLEILLTVSLRCSGNSSFSWAMHSLILSRLFFSISLWGNLYVSYRGVDMVSVKSRLLGFELRNAGILCFFLKFEFTLLSSFGFSPLLALNIYMGKSILWRQDKTS